MNRIITNYLVVGIVLLILGIIVLLLGLLQRQRGAKLGAKCTVNTSGTVKDVFNQQGNGPDPRFNKEQTAGWAAGDNWKLLVQFDAGGKTIKAPYWRGFRQRPAAFQPGQTVSVRYNPAKPEDFILTEDDTSGHVKPFWIVGALAILAGIAFLIVQIVM